MKRTLTTIACLLCLGFPCLLQAADVLASTYLQLKSSEKPLKIEKILDENGVSVRVYSENGQTLFDSGIIGSENKLFTFEGKAGGIAAHDFDGDGNAEILATAFYGPKASALYVFRFDKTAGNFAPMTFLNDKAPDLSTNFMVSDIRQDDGSDMVVNNDGSITALGMIYAANPEGKPVPGRYTWKLAGNSFKLAEKKANQ